MNMKKISCLVMLLLMLSAGRMYAQSFKDRTNFEAMIGTGIQNNHVTPVDFSFKLRVDIIPLFYMFTMVEDNISLFKKEEVKTYSNGASLGGGLGGKLLNGSKSNHALDIRLKALGSLGSPDWKCSTYDASLAWYMKSEMLNSVTGSLIHVQKELTITVTPICLLD